MKVQLLAILTALLLHAPAVFGNSLISSDGSPSDRKKLPDVEAAPVYGDEKVLTMSTASLRGIVEKSASLAVHREKDGMPLPKDTDASVGNNIDLDIDNDTDVDVDIDTNIVLHVDADDAPIDAETTETTLLEYTHETFGDIALDEGLHVLKTTRDQALKQKQRHLATYDEKGEEHGDRVECDGSLALSAICTSGRDRDCNNKLLSTLGKCTSLDVASVTKSSSNWSTKYLQEGFIACPTDSVAVALCAGGKEKDCNLNGKEVNYGLKCAKLNNAKLGATEEKCCTFGATCSCPTGSFVTQFCASGGAADCQCSSKKEYTGLKCSSVICNQGYEKESTSSSVCKPCGGGTYSSTATGGVCKSCSDGQYSSTAATSCTSCPAGSYSKSGSSKCTDCSVGYYSSSPGSSACQKCPAGKYSNIAKSTSCTTCPSGSYSPEGASSCSSCPDGTTLSFDSTRCIDIDECKDNSHGCPSNSKCVNKVKNEKSSSGDVGYNCECLAGFSASGGITAGNNQIVCAQQSLGVYVYMTTSSSISIKLKTKPAGLDKFDVHVSRYVTGSDTDELASSPYRSVSYSQFTYGYQISGLDPGSKYEFQLMSPGTSSVIDSVTASTSCECGSGALADKPSDLNAIQQDGFMMFEFTDQSRCEEGFDMTRIGPFTSSTQSAGSSKAVAFTSTYFYSSPDSCYEDITPGMQAADDLSISQLEVGKYYDYCVRAVGQGNAGIKYFSTETCKRTQILWQASIDGIVKLAPESGSLPVEGVQITYELYSNGRAILGTKNTMITDQSGKYRIHFSENDSSLDSTSDFEVRIWYQKKTLSEHRFLCNDGRDDCSGNSYTKVFLKHLSFDVEHSAIDDSTLPVEGTVVIGGTGRSKEPNNPSDWRVFPATECPLIGAKVCLQILNGRSEEGKKSCVDVDSSGKFGIGAPIGTVVKVEAEFHNHTFILEQKYYGAANANTGFEIVDGKKYESFLFKDVQKAPLLVNVAGGLCDRNIGNADVIVSLPSCSYWKGVKLSQTGVKQEHYVIAQDLKVAVNIVGRNDIVLESQGIDMTSIDKSDKQELGTDPGDDSVQTNASPAFSQALDDQMKNDEVQQAYQDSGDTVSEQKMLRFQYDGRNVISVTTNTNMATQSCKNTTIDSSFHVLRAYGTFLATFKVEQDFGDSKIARCDHLPDDTKVSILNQVGLTDNPSDNKFVSDMALDDKVIAEYKTCASQDSENLSCEYPSCCNIAIQHIESSDGTKSNAHVQELFRAGPPFIASPYLKIMIIQVGTTTHTMHVLVVGDYDDGVPDRYPLPAMDPIMILRDPPGSSSYAYYENVKTTTRLQIEGAEGYYGFKIGTRFATISKADLGMCLGLGALSCDENVFKADFNSAVEAEGDIKFTAGHKFNTFETSFVTTWSYQTSAESEPAGHRSDIFVVPSISLLLHKVTEISFDAEKCEGVAQKKVKFDAEPAEKDNALTFLSMDGIDTMMQEIDETKQTLIQMINDNEEEKTVKAAANSTLPLIEEAAKKWIQIISDYEVVNSFAQEAHLLKPSTFFEAAQGPEGHWSSLIPAELAPKVEKAVGLEEWEDVQLVSFSGGGGEFQYKVDKSFYNETEYKIGDFLSFSNFEQAYEANAVISFIFAVLGIGTQLDFSASAYGGRVATSFEHDISSVDSSMGFVLSDVDVGDQFDIKVAVDPTYGSFVFKTVGGISKCWHEEGTKQREKPNLSIKSKPVGEILHYNPAIFVVELANLGETSNDYDLSIENLDNIGGLGVFANGASLATNQPYSGMGATLAKESTISIHRGPVSFEYPPITLLFSSRCDGNAFATAELYTHIRKSDNAKVIRFARECPRVVLDGRLGTGLVVISEGQDGILPITVHNVERDYRGTFAEMAEDVDDTLEDIELLYRKRGGLAWNAARVTRTTTKDGKETEETFDLNLVLSKEDDFGYVSDEWKVEELTDGVYEVMVRSNCPTAPEEFKEATSQISILKLDRLPPKPFSFPSDTAIYHVGSALNFEFNEELDCVRPFSFTVEAKVEGSDREFNKDNLLLVCHDYTIGVQFDVSSVKLDEIDGKTVEFTLKDVRDVCGNVAVEDITSIVHFSSNAVNASSGTGSMRGNRRAQQQQHSVEREIIVSSAQEQDTTAAFADVFKSSLATLTHELHLVQGDLDVVKEQYNIHSQDDKDRENDLLQRKNDIRTEELENEHHHNNNNVKSEEILTLEKLFVCLLIMNVFVIAVVSMIAKRFAERLAVVRDLNTMDTTFSAI